MSDTPLYSALCALADQERLRFHMPGHKGNHLYMDAFADASRLDFTELPQTGNLYEGAGPILEAEKLAARFYGAEQCVFLTGGATQGIMAALFAVCGGGDGVILDRGCHRSVTNACGLLDLDPFYLYPERLPGFSVCKSVSKKELFELVERNPTAKAVVITSPTYYGAVSDIEALGEVLREAKMKLIVDEAHGAHLPAIGIKNAIRCGADIAVCSAHKTLPALGQGAYLLANGISEGVLRRAASVFGTSSPSYPIMASLDLARAYLSGEGGERYVKAALKTAIIREKIQINTTFRTPFFEKNDPCRLTIDTALSGLSGFFVAECLREAYRIDCEMSDRQNVVLIVTCEDGDEKLDALFKALSEISAKYGKTPDGYTPLPLPRPEKRMTPRKAMFSETRGVALQKAEGFTAAEPVAPYPPGIPVVIPGERIDRLCIEYLLAQGYNGYEEIMVAGKKDMK